MMCTWLEFQSVKDLLFRASQLFKAGTSSHKEHLSLTDIHAMFKDPVSEHQPAEVNLNLSAVQSFFRGFNPLTSI